MSTKRWIPKGDGAGPQKELPERRREREKHCGVKGLSGSVCLDEDQINKYSRANLR